jgi:N-acetylmuramoyl-L-alanine amidase
MDKLSAEDRDKLYTIRWTASQLLTAKNMSDGIEYGEDIINLVTEILDRTPEESHIDVSSPNEKWNESKEEAVVKNRVAEKPKVKGKIAIAIGHNKNTGARAIDGTDEWTTRKEVAEHLQDLLELRGIDSKIFVRNGRVSYGSAMREHGRNIDKYGADLAIELHFNAAIPAAHGTEFIVCSESGVKVARSLAKSWKEFYPDMTLRHDGGVLLRKNGRGVGFCKAPSAPAIIYEPFFSSNSAEWFKFKDNYKKEAEALCAGIVDYLA